MRLKRIEVNAFGGINPESPVVLDFSNGKWVVASGDQGTGKTSLLNSVLMACGQLSPDSKEGKNFINLDSKKIDINFSFVGKDRCNYNVRCTKSALTLTYEGVAVPEPLTKLKELLGVVGVSPMEIKNAKVSDIVKWLASYTNKSADEFERQMRKLKDGMKSAGETRAAANKIVRANDEYLSNEPMAQAWEESENKYSKAIDVTEVAQIFKQAQNHNAIYVQAKDKVQSRRDRKKDIEDEIAYLKNQLATVENEIKEGEAYLEKYKDVPEKLTKAQSEYENVAKESVNYNKWKEIKQKKSERDQAEDISQKADSQEKELKKKLADLRAEILPDIKDIALYTEDTHEDGKMIKEGLYWKGRNAAQMSETEWWSVVLQIWRKNKVKIVLIDNMQSLGSKGVELLEKLHNDGCYIVAAEMNRKKQELQIIYE